MSHFIVAVIFPKNMKMTDENLLKLMAPFDENSDTSQPKWDWYSVGGRWCGEMVGKPISSEDGFNFDEKYRTFEGNNCLVEEITPGWTPFAIITPKGEWIERGEMGWWAVVSNEKEEEKWEEEVKKVFAKYKGHTVVSVDTHI